MGWEGRPCGARPEAVGAPRGPLAAPSAWVDARRAARNPERRNPRMARHPRMAHRWKKTPLWSRVIVRSRSISARMFLRHERAR
eukprot:6043054-Prymnesium_polylepis.1